MIQRLLDSDYHTVDYDDATAVASVVRSPRPWPSTAALEEEMKAFAKTLQTLRPRKTSIVVDLRRAVGRNDPAFEKVFSPLREEALQGFRRVAFIVSSQVGRMQVQRFSREGNLNADAFTDEEQARAWAAGSMPPKP